MGEPVWELRVQLPSLVGDRGCGEGPEPESDAQGVHTQPASSPKGTRMGFPPPGLLRSLPRCPPCTCLMCGHSGTSQGCYHGWGHLSGSSAHTRPLGDSAVPGLLVAANVTITLAKAHLHDAALEELSAQDSWCPELPLYPHFAFKTQKPVHKERKWAPNTSGGPKPP